MRRSQPWPGILQPPWISLSPISPRGTPAHRHHGAEARGRRETSADRNCEAWTSQATSTTVASRSRSVIQGICARTAVAMKKGSSSRA